LPRRLTLPRNGGEKFCLTSDRRRVDLAGQVDEDDARDRVGAVLPAVPSAALDNDDAGAQFCLRRVERQPQRAL
jgi:hypothetical protein